MKTRKEIKTPIAMLNNRMGKLQNTKGKTEEYIKRVERRKKLLIQLKLSNKFFDMKEQIIYASKHRV